MISDLYAVKNVYRVHDLTEGAFPSLFLAQGQLYKMPLSAISSKICQLERRRSALSRAVFGTAANDI